MKSTPPPAFLPVLPCSDLSGQTKKTVKLPMPIYYLPATQEQKWFWATPKQKNLCSNPFCKLYFPVAFQKLGDYIKKHEKPHKWYDMTTQHLLRAPKTTFSRESWTDVKLQIRDSADRSWSSKLVSPHPLLGFFTDCKANPPRLPRVTWWVTSTF